MGDKNTKLQIIIATVDQATAKIKAINDRLDKATKPARDFKKAVGDLYEKSGLDKVAGGFKGVGEAVSGLVSKIAVIGGIAGVAVAGLFHIVNEFDQLGDKAERLGVSVDFLASMRYAAEKAGAPVESLDDGLQTFSENVGKLRANTGRLYSFLAKVSPELLKQVKAAKSNAEAFDLMAGAVAKLPDAARRAALTKAAFGGSDLAPLLAKGAAGVKELRDRYTELAGGSLQDAADKAGAVDDAMHDLHASTDGVKAALLSGLAPALKIVVDRLRDWLTGHREEIKEWAESIGKKLPDAIAAVVDWLGKAYDKVAGFVDAIGGIKGVAIAAAAILAGPVIASVASLTASLVAFWLRMKLIRSEAEAAQAAGGGAGKAGAGLLGGAAAPIAAAVAINSATGGSLLDVARSKGVDADNIIDLYKAAANGAFDKRPAPAGLAEPSSLRQAFGAAAAAKIEVSFPNAPRGTKVSADPKSTADIDLNVGYQMLPGLM